MAVGVECKVGSAVAKALLNRLVACSMLQQKRGAGVTQAVEREVFRQACVLAVAPLSGRRPGAVHVYRPADQPAH